MKKLPLLSMYLIFAAVPALAQSPFSTGAAQLPAQLLTILTPFAVVGVMGAFLGALFGRISWVWLVGIVLGIVGIFGAQQLVAWIRGIFGV